MAKAVKLLERDLQNGPNDCFGHHERCSPDFCLSAKERLESSRRHLEMWLPVMGILTTPDKSDDDLACKGLSTLDTLHKGIDKFAKVGGLKLINYS